MDIHSSGEWERLGTELRKRRGELGYGSRERKRFAAATGLHYRLVQRIETGEREGYPPETIAQVEAAYQLERDAIGAFFTTGRLQPARAEEPITDPDPYELAILDSDRLSYGEKVTEIHRHRERIAGEARKLAALGIEPPPVPSLVRRAVRAYVAETSGDGEQQESRGA